MPAISSKRTSKPISDTIDFSDNVELKPVARAAKKTTKDVPVGKIITGTLETRIASTLSKASSMTMLNTVGENYAATAQETYNVWRPVTRMIGRRVPDVALKINLDKPDADDLSQIILTVVEYFARIVDQAFTRLYNRRVARYSEAQHATTQSAGRSEPRVQQEQYIEPELEEFVDTTSVNSDNDIAPMRNGNGSLSDFIDRGYVPTDMGETVA
jgi:hypothetical protein